MRNIDAPSNPLTPLPIPPFPVPPQWLGFFEYAPVCVVCVRSPAETACMDCNTSYCGSCFRVFHAMGRKKKHKHQKLLEVGLGRSGACLPCVALLCAARGRCLCHTPRLISLLPPPAAC